MITLEEACKIALKYYAGETRHKVAVAEDAGESWYIYLGPKNEVVYGGLWPLLISKTNGEVQEVFEFTMDKELREILDQAKRVSIPPEYAEQEK